MYSLLEYYKNKIITAKTSLKMVTPYFIPPRWLLALLDDARRRNVEIEIIIPYDTDIKTLNKINYSYISQAAVWGIKFYASPVMNHAKILIVDGQEALIGSQNMDAMSLGRNFEVGVFSRQKDMVKDLNEIFEKWKKRSTPFQVAQIRLNWWDKIKVGAMRLFLSAI
jgi:cardiolipin synthase